jgi:predicted nucleotidyltransferase
LTNSITARIEAAASLYEESVLKRHTELRQAQTNSEQKLAELRSRFERMPPPEELGIHGLAVAGSLARREASELSDIDLIITTHSDSDEASVAAIKAWRNDFCHEHGIDPPNPAGVFEDPISVERLQSIAGASSEPYDAMSKRILFLLESTHLQRSAEYELLLDSVIDRYAEDVVKDPTKNFVFLLNDVVRYFRLVCVNYQQVKTDTPDGKWPLRNVKLRHSRVLMYFSMVAALGSLSRERTPAKTDALKLLARMHPLKRLFVAYQLADDTGFYRAAGLYDTFIALLSNPRTREALKQVEYETRYKSSVFAQLKANSDAFAAELMRFYDARRGQWDERFFEYMIL